MPIPTTAYAHVRLTVTDIARSRAFYDDVFGLPVAYELPPDADEETRRQGIKDIGAGYILEFRDPDNIALELFAPK